MAKKGTQYTETLS